MDAVKSDGWIIRNLREYHNSFIPDYVLDVVNGRKDLIPVLIKYASGINTQLTEKDGIMTVWEIM